MTDLSQEKITEQANILIEKKFGIFHSPENLHNLQRSLINTTKELGLHKDIGTLIHLLGRDSLTPAQEGILVSNLTVGETFFFRDMHTLNVFRDHVLTPMLDLRRSTSKSLRIWSAGCCSGEEPYTLAIMLTELLGDLDEWKIHITATDLNPKFLEKAERGVYTSWSFRNTREEIIDKYFIREKNTYELIPSIRKMVNFHHLNLALETSQDLPPHLLNQDVIFCRNVLMYFSPAQAAQVISRFLTSLTDKGWFIISPVESSFPVFSAFTPVIRNSITLYQKQLQQNPLPEHRIHAISPVVSPVSPAISPAVRLKTILPPSLPLKKLPDKPPDPAATAHKEYNEGRYEKAIETILVLADQGKARHELLFVLIRSYANLGKLQQAKEWSEKLIAMDKTKAGVHYLYAVILHEMDFKEEAEEALRKALYLDPGHILSHFLIGSISSKLGKNSKARKHFMNVKELLSAYKDEDVLPESEGMTAGRIREIVHSLQ